MFKPSFLSLDFTGSQLTVFLLDGRSRPRGAATSKCTNDSKGRPGISSAGSNLRFMCAVLDVYLLVKPQERS